MSEKSSVDGFFLNDGQEELPTAVIEELDALDKYEGDGNHLPENDEETRELFKVFATRLRKLHEEGADLNMGNNEFNLLRSFVVQMDHLVDSYYTRSQLIYMKAATSRIPAVESHKTELKTLRMARGQYASLMKSADSLEAKQSYLEVITRVDGNIENEKMEIEELESKRADKIKEFKAYFDRMFGLYTNKREVFVQILKQCRTHLLRPEHCHILGSLVEQIIPVYLNWREFQRQQGV